MLFVQNDPIPWSKVTPQIHNTKNYTKAKFYYLKEDQANN